jgi:hypothetical protein
MKHDKFSRAIGSCPIEIKVLGFIVQKWLMEPGDSLKRSWPSPKGHQHAMVFFFLLFNECGGSSCFPKSISDIENK